LVVDDTTIGGREMVDPFSALSGIVSGLQLSWQALEASKSVRDAGEIAAAVANAQSRLLEAQQNLFGLQGALFALQNSEREAREELRLTKEKIQEKGRYSLVKLAGGAFVYRSNPGLPGVEGEDLVSTEPEHHICPKCWDESGIKGVLQPYGNGVHDECPRCKATYRSHSDRGGGGRARIADGVDW
jgi:hypothetical protein